MHNVGVRTVCNSGGKPPAFKTDLKSATSFGSALTLRFDARPVVLLLLILSNVGRGVIVPQRIWLVGRTDGPLLWELLLAPEDLLPEAA